VNGDRQVVLDSRRIDGVKIAIPQGHWGCARHQHLSNFRMITKPMNFLDCKLGVSKPDHNRAAKTFVHRQPVMNEDIVDRRDGSSGIISFRRERHRKTVFRVQDCVVNAKHVQIVFGEVFWAGFNFCAIRQ
jgi:hypothetical protein